MHVKEFGIIVHTCAKIRSPFEELTYFSVAPYVKANRDPSTATLAGV